MTTAKDVLQVASRQIGTKEIPPGSKSNKYGQWYGMDRQPWCAMFVSYCLYQAKLPLKITGIGRCCINVDPKLNGQSKLVSIDKQSNY